jgi:hypothetical protein
METDMTSFARSTNHLADQLKSSAHAARGSLADCGSHAMKLFDSLHDRETGAVDSALERLGLQRRRSLLRSALPYAAGAVVVGAVALLLIPTTGKRIRANLAGLFAAAGDREACVDAVAEHANGPAPAEKTNGQVDHAPPRIVPTHQS